MAVAVGIYGLHSDEALMSVIGALIEIPTMLALVNVAFYFRKNLFKAEGVNNKVVQLADVDEKKINI